MIGEQQLIDAIGQLEADALQRWVDFGWVLPQTDGGSLHFDTADVARVRLICDLHYEMRIEESSLSVVLSLMDQLYDVRRDLRRLVSAIEAQPEEVRADIANRAMGRM
jgi:chaperone modulatory protein CbpM